MMSETAFFVKDIVGPKGSVSLVPNDEARQDADNLSSSADIDKHPGPTRSGFTTPMSDPTRISSNPTR